MSELSKIKEAFQRTIKALTQRPSVGLGTGLTKIHISNGLTCEIVEGPWKLTADMPKQAGGNSSAPTPGVYGRAALGSCLAIGYMMYAAKLDIAIISIEVEVQADYDDGALFGTSDIPAGYSEVRYKVIIKSNASETDILKVLNEGDAHSPYLDVFSRAQKCLREVVIIPISNS
ncbi:OsmC family protein [Solitalea koreensis]|uniref:OsmC-like protein n=1 Tax=Solitalea koreensis TaxID=543615 RepID=A0A521C1L8_9SPHI|nr:OsmC family protein [Solitalea koreensis]SMO53352.1 OsmC-like protein [Solitalea koreensis]